MKKILSTLAVTLSLAAWGTQALAGGPHGQGHHPRASTGHHQRSSDWLGPLIVLGIASAAISAAAQPSYSPPPQVTYVSPQVTYTPAAPPPGASFFCSSVGQFYPHTNYCPEGWQMVVPR
jgi:hypothetical protein